MASAAKTAAPTGGRAVFMAWAIHLYAWFFGRWVVRACVCCVGLWAGWLLRRVCFVMPALENGTRGS